MEPPGTAPGSDPLITRVIYRHSPRTGDLNIGIKRKQLKALPETAGMEENVKNMSQQCIMCALTLWARVTSGKCDGHGTQ